MLLSSSELTARKPMPASGSHSPRTKMLTRTSPAHATAITESTL